MSLAEEVGSWFFRLNGFAVIENFIVHPEAPGGQRTDLDVYGVRFPHRAELHDSRDRMRDHEVFTAEAVGHRIQVVLVEIKQGHCALNGPWTDSSKRNMQRVLRAVGVVPEESVETAAQCLYARGEYATKDLTIRLCAVGSRREGASLPERTLTLTWPEVLAFIHDRFNHYWRVKADNRQWSSLGRRLYEAATASKLEQFTEGWLREIGASR